MARKKTITTITLDKEVEEKLFFFSGKKSPLINEIIKRLFDDLSQDEIISLAREKSIEKIVDKLLQTKIVSLKTISENTKESKSKKKKKLSKPSITNKYQDWW